ncbi:MAG: hypothetical protein GMKNLPBB_03111 [Myxococcota bacterium]|nr:hypothetical protein [Myxococcota bacterium]
MAPTRIEYDNSSSGLEGMFTQLLPKLLQRIEFDAVDLHAGQAGKQATLWLRSQGKTVYHIRVVRRGVRTVLELGHISPAAGLELARICKTHFDSWFGITREDILAYEDHHQPPNGGKP